MSIRGPDSRAITLITGATDGIGRALAERYAARGDRVVGVGRKAAGEAGYDLGPYCRADLSTHAGPGEVTAFLRENGIESVDRLILNAGTAYYGETGVQTSASIAEVVTVNLRSSVALVHGCWPMVKAARGTVVFVGSVIAALPCPEYAVYGATKAAVDGLARSLRYELAPEVAVQVIHPGATRTGLHAKIGVDRTKVDWERFPSADSVAERVVSRIEAGRHRALTSVGDRVLWTIGRRLPRLADRVVGRG